MRRHLPLLLLAVVLEAHAVDIDRLWNFDDPAASEANFRAALADARGDDALVLQTQIARTYSLRRRFADAHAALDAIAPQLERAGAEPRMRALLERGRTFRSAGEPARARPLFADAVTLAESAKLRDLAIDAMHMVALVEPAPDDQLAWNRRALAAAEASPDPNARRWVASLANNLGVALHGQKRYDEALAMFRSALAARERMGGNPARVRVARWMIAWTLRAQGKSAEALEILHALDREWAAAGGVDGYVFEEIGENLLAQGRADDAKPWFAKAFAAHDAVTTVDRPDDPHLARLKRLAETGRE